MAAMDMNKAGFEQALAGELPVLVDLWAPWCGYCRRIGPAFEQVARENEGRLVAAKINVDEEPELAKDLGAEVIPTLLLYRGGRALGTLVAPDSRAAIDRFLAGHLGE